MKKLAILVASLSLMLGCSYAENRGTILDYLGEAYRIEDADEPQGEDCWQTPKETLRLGKGDCEDKTFLLRSLLFRNGIETSFVFGYINPGKSKNMHAWLEYNDGKETWIFDPENGLILARSNVGDAHYRKAEYTQRLIQKHIDYNNREIREIQEELGE